MLLKINVQGYAALRKLGEDLGGVDIATVPSDIMLFEFAALCGLGRDDKLQLCMDAWYEDEVPKQGWVMSASDESYHFWKDGKLRASVCVSAMGERFIGFGYAHDTRLEYDCSLQRLEWQAKNALKRLDSPPQYAKLPTRPVLPVTEKSV